MRSKRLRVHSKEPTNLAAMGKRGSRKWTLPRFLCFARPAGVLRGDEHWTAAPKPPSAPALTQEASFTPELEQGRPDLSRDSHDRLAAYFGERHLLRGGAGSILTQEELDATLERRLTGGDGSSSTDAQLNSDHQSLISRSQTPPHSSPHARGGFSRGSSYDDIYMVFQQDYKELQTPSVCSSDTDSVTAVVAGGDTVDATPQSQLLAAPNTPSPQQAAGVAQSSPNSNSADAKKKQDVGTPQNSDRNRGDLHFSGKVASGRKHTKGTTIQKPPPMPMALLPRKGSIQETVYPGSVMFNTHTGVFTPSDSSVISMPSDGGESFTASIVPESGESEVPSPSASYSSLDCSSVHRSIIHLSDISSSASMAGSTESRPRRLSRSITMPIRPRSTAQHEETTLARGSSVGSMAHPNEGENLMRRHTAVIIMDTDDEEEEEEEIGEESGAVEVGTAIRGSDGSLIPTMRRIRRTKSAQQKLSEVYEGHHVQLQKLRKQMGDTQGRALYFITRLLLSF